MAQIDIILAATGEDIRAVQDIWSDYWEDAGLTPQFQGFADERSSLPGVYTRLLLACVDGQVAGTAALRPLSEHACEAKRLYVRPQYRSLGVARALLARLVGEARSAGYREMYGDTLKSMGAALRLYNQIGFVEVGPYTSNPTPDAIFLKLSL